MNEIRMVAPASMDSEIDPGRMDTLKEAISYMGKLRDHALSRLPLMVDKDTGLFSYSSSIGKTGWKNKGTSIRYSAIAILGLLEAARKGCRSPIDIGRMLRNLHEHMRETGNSGDIGLILWASARAWGLDLISRAMLEEALSNALTHLKREWARRKRIVDSMQYSWMLLALLECRSKGLKIDGLEEILGNLYSDLALNFDRRSSLFVFHRIEDLGKPHKRKRLAFFAEQIYGILALATYFETTGEKRALDAAVACADKIAAMQTPKGGWPWRYNVRRGTLAETYPLFSVHQDGMAPMALAKLTAVSGQNYVYPLCRGILWLDGRNEAGAFLYDETQNIIWRGIQRSGPLIIFSELNKAFSLINVQSCKVIDRIAPFFEFIREARSYHLGWILCAWASLDDLGKEHFTETQ